MTRRLAWYDGVFLLGLLLIAAGLALWSTPVALIVTGAELVLISVLAALRSRSAPPLPSAPPVHGTPDIAPS